VIQCAVSRLRPRSDDDDEEARRCYHPSATVKTRSRIAGSDQTWRDGRTQLRISVPGLTNTLAATYVSSICARHAVALPNLVNARRASEVRENPGLQARHVLPLALRGVKRYTWIYVYSKYPMARWLHCHVTVVARIRMQWFFGL